MKRTLTLSTIATLLLASSGPVMASDARAVALGGSVIANGKGVHGALANPASLMAMKRRGESTHILAGSTAEFRDAGGAIDTVTDEDNDDLISDIDREITLLSNSPVQCIPTAQDPIVSLDDDCIGGTQPLSDLSGRLLDIIDIVDEQTLDVFGASNLGMAYTANKIPFAVNLHGSLAGFARPDISATDQDYISEFSSLLDENSITWGEIQDTGTDYLSIQNGLLTIVQPEEVLQSGGNSGVLLRTQFSVSLATTLDVAGYSVDVGVTPKLSSLIASSLNLVIGDEFQENVRSAGDRFEDNEVSESSFTADIGASMMLPQAPVQVAAVIRNLIPESITTEEGFEFETTPQLILGASYQRDKFTFNGDLALNSAKQDNFETHKMGVGVEFGTSRMALRAGIAHDAARTNDSTSLSLGFALGPLEIGGRVAGLKGIEAGAQLAFSFD